MSFAAVERKGVRMNGAERLLETAASAGVEVCFANPGTTELTIVSALDRYRSIRPVLTLFEGVATGAADGYGRMAERPALTLMHLGPGLGNGVANLHNARRARSPVVNLVGDHPAWLSALDPPLASDIDALAHTVSAWVRTTCRATDLGKDVAEAIAAAWGAPGQVATLIIPADCQWGEAGPPSPPPTKASAPAVDGQRLERVREALVGGAPSALLLGGAALRARGLRAAARVAAVTGCRLLCESFPARLECGQGLPALERIPYVPGMVLRLLSGVRTLVLAGAEIPVPYFADADAVGLGRVVPEATSVESLARPTEDVIAALEALADALGAPPAASVVAKRSPLQPTNGPLTIHSVVAALTARLPDGSILVDEGVSHGGALLRVSERCTPHDYLSLTGGATGYGLPCALGAAIACPGRKVVALVGDGSAMYTIQALWTQAREGLDVVTLICANDGYRILELEMMRRHGAAGQAGRALTDLSRPRIDWVGVARGLGVPASSATSVPELMASLERSFAEAGPHLIEVRM